MREKPGLRIDEEDGDYVIRIPRDCIGREDVRRFFDYLTIEAGSHKFDMSEQEMAAFADEIDHAAWKRLRPTGEAKLRSR